MATKDWTDKFQMSKLIHLSSHASDYLPILLQTQSYRKQRTFGGKCFKFEEAWLLWEDCEEVVEGAWNMNGNKVLRLSQIKQKIEAYGAEFKAWGAAKSNPDTEVIKQL